jgi:hypothetical protein
MADWQLTTPVAFFIFNRPDTTARVFEAIRRAAPPRLLIVADGPRPGRPGETEQCAAARAVVAGVDWPCQVSHNFSESNLGCRSRVSSGLDWVFETVEEAIILEDDCLPHPSFFRFCQELLERYRDDRRVMTISGNNHLFGRKDVTDSYYFSRYPHIWGWACWRRSWQLYDADMAQWPQVRDAGGLEASFPPRQARYWRYVFEAVRRGEIDTWDYQLTFSCLLNQALCITPTVNLVSNLGFGAGATNTTDSCRLAELAAEPMDFPLRHPAHLVGDVRSDRETERIVFSHPLGLRVRTWLGEMLRRFCK